MTAKSIMRLYDVTSGDVLHRMNEPMGGTGGGGWLHPRVQTSVVFVNYN